jgi:hypothetical protein
MWSFVQRKKAPRWLWHALDHRSGKVLAYVFGRRKDEVFLKLRALLEPFGITRYYLEHGHKKQVDVVAVRRLAKALGVGVDSLVGTDDPDGQYKPATAVVGSHHTAVADTHRAGAL